MVGMRALSNVANTIKRYLGRFISGVGLFALATVGTAFADNVSKSFEFGGGLELKRSNVKTFSLPCGTEGGVAAVVKFTRLGPEGRANDIPIIIELREPDTAADQEGPVVETKTASATRTEQTVTLYGQSSIRGCTLPWRVRIRHANEGAAPSPVSGTIRIDFDGRLKTTEGESGGCVQGGFTTRNVGSGSGFAQGQVEITVTWAHGLGGACLPGPNPIKLRVELIDPSGTVVETVEAYSSNELRSELPRFKIVHQVRSCVRGQWKLKFTKLNLNEHVSIARPTVKFTPGCP
jgi:hypothetical protein